MVAGHYLIEALTKRLRDLGQENKSAMTTISQCSWRHAPIIRCRNPRDWETLEKAIASRRPRLQQAALRQVQGP